MKTKSAKIDQKNAHHLTRDGATVSAFEDIKSEFRRVYCHTFGTVTQAKAWMNRPGLVPA